MADDNIEIYNEQESCLICSECIDLTLDSFMNVKSFRSDSEVTSEFESIFSKWWLMENLTSSIICGKCSLAIQTLLNVKLELLKLFKNTNNIQDTDYDEVMKHTIVKIKNECYKSSAKPLGMFNLTEEDARDLEIQSKVVVECSSDSQDGIHGRCLEEGEERMEIQSAVHNAQNIVDEGTNGDERTSEIGDATKMDSNDKFCTICSKTFSSARILKTHLKTHTSIKSFVCQICNKAFAVEYYLRKHTLRHVGIRKFTCAFCDKSFKDLWRLNTHERSHTGERPYGCNYCDKRFSQLDKMKVHQRIHTGKRPYKCQYCDHAFNEQASCIKHETVIHLKQRPFPCKHCNEGFTNRRSRKEHYEKIHPLLE